MDNIFIVAPALAIIGVSASSILHSVSPEITSTLWKQKDSLLGLLCMIIGLSTAAEVYLRLCALGFRLFDFADVMLDPLAAPAFQLVLSLLVLGSHFWGLTSSLTAAVQWVLLAAGGISSVVFFLWAGLCSGKLLSGFLYSASVLLGVVAVQGAGMMLGLSVLHEIGVWTARAAGVLFRPLRAVVVRTGALICDLWMVVYQRLLPALFHTLRAFSRSMYAAYETLLLPIARLIYNIIVQPLQKMVAFAWSDMTCPAASAVYTVVLSPTWRVLCGTVGTIAKAIEQLRQIGYRMILLPFMKCTEQLMQHALRVCRALLMDGIVPAVRWMGRTAMNALSAATTALDKVIIAPLVDLYHTLVVKTVAAVVAHVHAVVLAPMLEGAIVALTLAWDGIEVVGAKLWDSAVTIATAVGENGLLLLEAIYDASIWIIEHICLSLLQVTELLRAAVGRGGGLIRRTLLAVWAVLADPMLQLYLLAKRLSFPLLLLASGVLFLRNAIVALTADQLRLGLLLGSYVNIVVGCMLMSAHIPNRAIATSLLKLSLLLYNQLDFGVLLLVIRSAQATTELIRNALVSLNRLVSTLWKAIFDVLNLLVENAVKGIWSAATFIYKSVLRPLHAIIRGSVLLIWSNPFISLSASLAVLFLSYHLHHVGLLGQLRAIVYKGIIQSTELCSDSVRAIISMTVSFASMPMVRTCWSFTTATVGKSFAAVSDETGNWISVTLERSLFVLCSNNAFGWTLYACHAVSSALARENRVDPRFIARGWMKAFYFPLFFISIFSSSAGHFISSTALMWLGLGGLIILSVAAIHTMVAVFVAIVIGTMVAEFLARISAPFTSRRGTSTARIPRAMRSPGGVRVRTSASTAQAPTATTPAHLAAHLRGLEPMHKFDSGECSICCDSYSSEAGAAEQCGSFAPLFLPCGHKFHEECVLHWLQAPQARGLCPICRERVPLPNDRSANNIRFVLL